MIMAHWYDDYLYADERHKQISGKAARARPRMRAVQNGEMKFVPTYKAKEGQDTSRASRNETIRNNARRFGNFSDEDSYREETRKTLKNAFSNKR